MSDPYMPSSGTEGMDFEAKWCANCRKDENHDCPLLANAYIGIQPDAWVYWRGDPLCRDFDGDEYPKMSGFAVADLFPNARKRPTQGEQIRMLVQGEMQGGAAQ